MQTFLPYPNFYFSARSLDDKRLRNQANEALVILRTITGWYKHYGQKGWPNHPAAKMWIGHAGALYQYLEAVASECAYREFSCKALRHARDMKDEGWIPDSEYNQPTWLHNSDFHISHQSNLVRKYPEYYRPQFPDVPDNLPYVWPSKNTNLKLDI